MKKVIFLLLTLCSLNLCLAQNKVIKGNGNIDTRSLSVSAFTHLSIDMFCDVHVQLGAMQMATIEGDRNVINKIVLNQNGGKLEIKVKDGFWIQKSRPKIYLQTPFLTKLTTKGDQTNIGKVVIEGIEVDKFETDILYGEISLIGSVRELLLNSSNRNYYNNSGVVDASQLTATIVKAEIYGSNKAIVKPIKQLKAKLKYDAVLEYVHSPAEFELLGDAVAIGEGLVGVKDDSYKHKTKEHIVKKTSLEYVTVKVKNNSMKRRHFIIKGPNESGRGFSYGFPMMPLAVREKNVPVGTKIMLQKGGILNKKLITISADTDGQTVNLFN